MFPDVSPFTRSACAGPATSCTPLVRSTERRPSREVLGSPARMQDAIARDLAAIARISAVPTLLRTMRQATDLRFTLIARVLPDRWVACAVHDDIEFGLKVGGELDVATTLCSQVRDTHQPVVIDHATEDDVYCTHPTPKMYRFESYIAVPIFRRDGSYFGNVCGLDPLPRKLKDEKTLDMVKLFAEVVSLQLEAEEGHEGAQLELSEQREVARLREEFMALLGHDLRDPLTSIVTGMALLHEQLGDAAQRHSIERMAKRSERMLSLLDSVTDLARGRLGGGIEVEMADIDGLPARLAHVIEDVKTASPDRHVNVEVRCDLPLCCDEKRVAQALLNLLANAVQHGAAGSPVDVVFNGDASVFEMSVINQGPAIAPALRTRLFHPYFRREPRPQSRAGGLGLGLYIVSEIATAHGGTVEVVSSDERTMFTFRIPRGAQDRPLVRP